MEKDKLFKEDRLSFILGPCVIESREQTLVLASKVKELSQKNNADFIFKASFDKANRTSIEAFRGPGLEKGLKILDEVKREFSLPILTDIHLPTQAKPVAEVVDVIQIPAFLCRQTDLLLEASKTGKWINVKKGQFLSPESMAEVVKKIRSQGNSKISLTERGTFFGYNNLIVDFTSFLKMKKLGATVVFDATHSVQKPGAHGDRSGGAREFVPMLARAAIGAGVDAIFMEIHENPEEAKSDASTSISLANLDNMIGNLSSLFEMVKEKL